MSHKKLRHINAYICTLIFSLSLFLGLGLAGCGNGGHTENPAFIPTVEPTVEPTTEPTDEPTAQPTDEPTSEPTTEPTGEPTSVEPDYEEIELTGFKQGDEYPYFDEDSVLARLGYTATIDGYECHLYKDGQEVTDLVIPETFEKDGTTYKIIGVAPYTFFWCTSLASINLPESVTSIGNNAFDSCRSLTSVNIPESVTSIGKGAFVMSDLTSITISKNVTSIGEGAFCDCTYLITAVLPDGLTSIGAYAFGECSNLTSIVWKGTTYTDNTEFNTDVSGISGGAPVWVWGL